MYSLLQILDLYFNTIDGAFLPRDKYNKDDATYYTNLLKGIN